MNIKLVLRWFFGIAFGVTALSFLSSFHIIAGLSSALICVILIPPLNTAYEAWVKKKYPKTPFSRGTRIVMVIILIFIMASTSPKSDTKSSNSISSTIVPSNTAQNAPKTPTTVPVTPKPTSTPKPTATPAPTLTQSQRIAELNNEYSPVSLSVLDKDTDPYTNKKVSFTCTIAKFLKDSSGKTSAINCRDSSGTYAQVSFLPGDIDFMKVNEEDVIKVYVIVDGTLSGENAFGAKIYQVGTSLMFMSDLTSGYTLL